MFEFCDVLRFEFETPHKFVVMREMRQQDLQRDIAVERGLECSVDSVHEDSGVHA
jgi:hypothetical protein